MTENITARSKKERMREFQKRERIYMRRQKVLGIALVLGSIGFSVAGYFADMDVTAVLIAVPLGVGLLISKECWL